MSDKVKIVYLSDDFPPRVIGGAGIIAFQQALAMKARGYEVSVITAVQSKKDAGHRVYEGLNVYNLYSKYPEVLRSYISLNHRSVVKQVAQILTDIKPDIVHCHNIHTHLSYASLKIARRVGAKVFLTLHDVMAVYYGKLFPGAVKSEILVNKWRYNPLRNLLIKKYLKYAHKLFAVSDAIKNILEARIQNIVTIHNGIDVNAWKTNENDLAAFKEEYNLADKKVIFFGGRLSGAKGSMLAVEIINRLANRRNNLILLIVGKEDSPSALEMKKRAAELGIEKRLIFTGWLQYSDMKNAISSADIVAVLSRYYDPFPTINLEAMACKKPVIGGMYGGTKEIVSDGQTGYIVDPRDIDSCLSKFEILLNDEKTCSIFGERGYERVKNDFSLDKHMESLIRWYNTTYE